MPSVHPRRKTSPRLPVAVQLHRLCSPLVEFNRFDLWHDRQLLRANPGIAFVCIVRSGGTWLVTRPEADHPDIPPAGSTAPFLFGSRPCERMVDGNVEFLRAEAARAAVEERTWFEHRGDDVVREVLPADAVG